MVAQPVRPAKHRNTHVLECAGGQVALARRRSISPSRRLSADSKGVTRVTHEPRTAGFTRLIALAVMLAACTAPAPVATPGPTESAASTPGAAPTGNPIPTHPPGPDLPALDVATDPQAEALAGRVLAGGDEARAALDAAIEAAGLGIIDTEGLLLTEPAQPSQGLAFGAYEVQALVDLEALGFAQPATDLAEVIAAPLAELDGEPVASAH